MQRDKDQLFIGCKNRLVLSCMHSNLQKLILFVNQSHRPPRFEYQRTIESCVVQAILLGCQCAFNRVIWELKVVLALLLSSC